MRTRHTLILGSLTSLVLAFLLGTASRSNVADAVSRPPATSKRTLPTRTLPATDLDAASTDRPSPELLTVAVAIELSADLSSAILPATLLMPEWDPELAWPLPEDLPDDPVVLALQEVLSADIDTDDHAEALDTLDLAMLDGPAPSDPWSHLAHIEAERQLVRAAYHDNLLDHNRRLVDWSQSGGMGPRPEAPGAWQATGLADEALNLALAIDAFDEDPAAADIARLTAAAVLLDWESGVFDEGTAVEAIFDVIHHTASPTALATATDLLVGTRTTLTGDQLAELTALSDQLPGPSASRLAWFVAGRHLAHDRPDDALNALDQGIDAGTMSPADTLDSLQASLEAGRGALLGITGRDGGRSLRESVQAAAWGCWGGLLEGDSAWVRDGTDYRALAIATPGGIQWVDWTDDNDHRRCLADTSDTFVLPDEPVQLRIEIQHSNYKY